ncbi:MAG TPA: BlaI/MecI/CopY family transcriptional regulator [Candidatus Limnocylindrales bacterium]|nr:BlaI/MecI/CopY family transcriptional regulator [Candidatus Limnocylindrales bacterium]
MSELVTNSTEAAPKKRPSPRRSVLDLAPLELDCMNMLWPLGEGTVRDIRDRLAPRRPRAYTTIMTIMDRLARKGIVERRKSGRAYIYRANLTAEEARTQALGQVIENFFDGSREALLAQLGASSHVQQPRAFAAVAAAATGGGDSSAVVTSHRFASAAPTAASTSSNEPDAAERIDDTLL